MWGLLLIWLIIELYALAAEFWPLLVAALTVYLLLRLVVVPVLDARAVRVRDHRRHEQARREIEQIYQSTVAAMSEAAYLAKPLRPRAGTDVERTRMDRAERRRHDD